MKKTLTGMLLSVTLIAQCLPMAVSAQESTDTTPWSSVMTQLKTAPKYYTSEDEGTQEIFEANGIADESDTDGIIPIMYESVPYSKQTQTADATRVFAWYGVPDTASAENLVPAMVLVHGGGACARKDWVEYWVNKGYAAIAMDLNGCTGSDDVTPKKHTYGWDYADSYSEGGLGQSADEVTDQWTYHAVAAVIEANSFISSLECVDSSKVGVTGISWGGFTTCIAAGVDDRFAFAAPVYGCGYLYEDSQMAPIILNFTNKATVTDKTDWIGNWDPSNYLDDLKMPILFVNSPNDTHFYLDSYKKSYDLVPGEKYLSVQAGLTHGMNEGMSNQAVAEFADAMTDDDSTTAFNTLNDFTYAQGTASALSSGEVEKAYLAYTTDQAKYSLQKSRVWTTVEAQYDTSTGKITAAVPEEAEEFYLYAVDSKGTVSSTTYLTTYEEPVRARGYSFDDFEGESLNPSWKVINGSLTLRSDGGAGISNGCAAFTTQDIKNARWISKWYYLENGETYDISAWVKLDNWNTVPASSPIAVRVDGTIKNTSIVAKNEWQLASVSFTYEGETGYRLVELMPTRNPISNDAVLGSAATADTDYTTLFDDISIVKQSESADTTQVFNFDAGNEGWNADSPSSAEWTEETGYDTKPGCMLFTEADGATGTKATFYGWEKLSVEAGKTYEISAWIKLISDVTPTTPVNFYFNSTGEFQNYQTYTTLEKDKWVKAAYVFTATENVDPNHVRIFLQKNGFDGEAKAYIDGITIKEYDGLGSEEFETLDTSIWKSSGTREVSKEAAYSGSYGMKMTTKNEQNYVQKLGAKLVDDQRYKISVWAKLSDDYASYEPEGEFCFRIKYADNAGGNVYNKYVTTGQKVTGYWQKFEIDYTPDTTISDLTYASVQIMMIPNYQKGVADESGVSVYYFDDFNIEKIGGRIDSGYISYKLAIYDKAAYQILADGASVASGIAALGETIGYQLNADNDDSKVQIKVIPVTDAPEGEAGAMESVGVNKYGVSVIADKPSMGDTAVSTRVLFDNATKADKDVTIYLAQYDDDGKLVKVSTETHSVKSLLAFDKSITDKRDKDASKVKVLCWDTVQNPYINTEN